MLHEVTPPYERGHIAVSGGHRIAWRQAGAPEGRPILYIHGGPGGRSQDAARALSDPAHWRIIQFDQRGCGASTPRGDVHHNTTPDLIADMEALRETVRVERWAIFARGWGAALALAYAQAHPACCAGLVLSAVTLGEPAEAEWFYSGSRWILPAQWLELMSVLTPGERDAPLGAFHRRVFSDDGDTANAAAAAIHRFDLWLSRFMPDVDPSRATHRPDDALHYARLWLHYAHADFFLGEDVVLSNMASIRHLPAEIVQGRYDLGVSNWPAARLARAWPEAKLTIVPDGAYAASDPPMANAIAAAITRMQSAAQW